MEAFPSPPLPSPAAVVRHGSRVESDDILGENWYTNDHNLYNLIEWYLEDLPKKRKR